MGKPAWHPKHGFGTAGQDDPSIIVYENEDGPTYTSDLDDWQPVTVVRPGEVAVRVDDIADDLVKAWHRHNETPFIGPTACAALRTVKAILTQREQGTSEATLKALPTEITVRLACSRCGEPLSAVLGTEQGERLAWIVRKDSPDHVCKRAKPVIPDEPTDPGSRWRLDGKRCVRDASAKDGRAWLDVDSGGSFYRWADFTSHVKGWGE